MILRISILVGLTLAAFVLGDPPSLILPDKIEGEVGNFLIVRAATEGKQVKWVALDRGLNVFPSELLKESKATVVVAVKPGTYRLVAVTSLNDELSDLVSTTVVIAGDSGPTPPRPTPDPVPDPKPEPAPGRCWLVIIEETGEAAANRAIWLNEPSVVKYLRDKGWRHRIADKDVTDASGQTPKDLAPYISRAKLRGPLPYLFVVDERGKPRYEGAVPRTPAEMLALLQKIGG